MALVYLPPELIELCAQALVDRGGPESLARLGATSTAIRAPLLAWARRCTRSTSPTRASAPSCTARRGSGASSAASPPWEAARALPQTRSYLASPCAQASRGCSITRPRRGAAAVDGASAIRSPRRRLVEVPAAGPPTPPRACGTRRRRSWRIRAPLRSARCSSAGRRPSSPAGACSCFSPTRTRPSRSAPPSPTSCSTTASPRASVYRTSGRSRHRVRPHPFAPVLAATRLVAVVEARLRADEALAVTRARRVRYCARTREGRRCRAPLLSGRDAVACTCELAGSLSLSAAIRAHERRRGIALRRDLPERWVPPR